jgi:hypothetical protein
MIQTCDHIEGRMRFRPPTDRITAVAFIDVTGG